MKKEDFIKRILELDEGDFNKFMSISGQILGLLDTGKMINTSINEIPVSEKLKNARKEREITQIELAKALNLSRVQIGSIESGSRQASKEIAKRLSKYFKTDIGYWL